MMQGVSESEEKNRDDTERRFKKTKDFLYYLGIFDHDSPNFFFLLSGNCHTF